MLAYQSSIPIRIIQKNVVKIMEVVFDETAYVLMEASHHLGTDRRGLQSFLELSKYWSLSVLGSRV